MRLFLALNLTVCLAAAAWATEPAVDEQAAEQGADRAYFFVHLNCSPENQRAVVSTLELTKTLSSEQSDVTLFIDLGAVALAESTGDTRDDEDDPIETLFASLIQEGVHILVCPHCAKEAGIDARRIRPGARFTSKEEIQAATKRADKVFEYQRPLAEDDDDSPVAVNET